jgi:Sec-independent protein translocase protein TatA
MHMKRTRFDCKAFVTVLLSVVLMAFVISHTAYAASSATFGVTVPSTSVGIGDTVEITVQLSPGKENISDYSYTINYDPALLEAVSGGTVEDEGSISYSGSSGSEESMTATFTFTALASGTASIETRAVDVISTSGESIDMTPAYNSINISDAVSTYSQADESETETDETETGNITTVITSDTEQIETVTLSQDTADEPPAVDAANNSDSGFEDSTQTVSDYVVSLHSSNNTYYILNKPASVDTPSSYLPVKIKINDTDVKAYMKGTGSSTVLLYAADENGNQGWYFFNTDEGTFMNASDIIGQSDSLSSFMSEHKFVIMLIAIIVLVILVVIIVILAVSLKGLIADYETQIDRLKKDNDARQTSSGNKASDNSSSDDKASESGQEKLRIHSHDSSEVPTINNKALFPDDEAVHESYADSDYDNQVVPDEYDHIHADDTDDYDDTAFDSNSMEAIDAALESAKKYKD